MVVKQKIKKIHSGMTVVEIMVAVGIFAIIGGSLLVMVTESFDLARHSTTRGEAESFCQEGIEAAKSIQRRYWSELRPGARGLDNSSGYWTISGSSNTRGNYTRVLTIEDVYRDADGNIVPAGGGAVLDVWTKKIQSRVDWAYGLARNDYIVLETYLYNWKSVNFDQTDWSGGGGQAVFSDAARYWTDDGNIDVSTAGEVKLRQGASVGFFRWVPGGGTNATHTTDSDFGSGTFGGTAVLGTGIPASVVLDTGTRWITHQSSGASAFAHMLRGVDFLSPSLGYAVGDVGTIIKWNGVKWVGITSNTSSNLYAVDIIADNDVWVVGDGGIIMHWNGFIWSNVISPTTKDLRAVHMVSASDGWAAGKTGTILRWNGAVWTTFSSPTNKDIGGIDFVSAADGWAVAKGADILHWNGTAWSLFAHSATNNDLYGVDFVDATHGWAVGSAGDIIYYNGTAWSFQSTVGQRELHNISMVSASYGVAVGGNGVGEGELLEWNGSTWADATPAGFTVNGQNGVHMFSSSSGQAVGGAPNEAQIMQYSSGVWQDITGQLGSKDIFGIDMLSSSSGWAVGLQGAIFQWNNADWVQKVSPTNNDLNSVSFINSSNGWAVSSQGQVFYCNGSSWSLQATPIVVSLNGLHMVSAADGWAVGISGNIVQWNGANWSSVISPTANTLNSVHLIASNDGWAVGDSGAILRWNGSAWSIFASPTANRLNAVRLFASNDGWAVGDSGTILRWNGTNWTTASSPTSAHLNEIRIITSNNAWAVGDNGVIIHWNGTNWTTETSPTGQNIYALDHVTATDIWAGAKQAVFIRYGNSFYENSGTYLSPVIDSGSGATHWDYAYWAEDAWIISTDLVIDTRTGNSPVPDGTWSSFSGSYSDDAGEAIVSPNGRYLQYRLTLSTSDARYTPELKMITVNYNNPSAALMNSVDMISETSGFAVANGGIISKYNGTAWVLESSPTGNDLNGVDFVDGNTGWAAGDGGIIASYDLGVWSTPPSPTGNNLNAVHGIDASHAWAAGDAGTIIKWDGVTWATESSPTGSRLNGIYMVSASDGWAVGAGGVILRYNGANWSSVSSPTVRNLYAVFIFAANDGWAVGDSGEILRWNGSSWSVASSPTSSNLRGIFMAGSSDGWAVGASGRILRYNGYGWSVYGSPTAENLSDVSLGTAINGWVVGANGIFLRLSDLGGLFTYPATGIIESSAVNTGSPKYFNIIAWDETLPAPSGFDVWLQIKTAPDSGGSPGAWSATWCGPDGEDGDENDYFETNPGGEYIHPDHIADQWIKYRAILTSDGTDTPVFENVRINYQNY